MREKYQMYVGSPIDGDSAVIIWEQVSVGNWCTGYVLLCRLLVTADSWHIQSTASPVMELMLLSLVLMSLFMYVFFWLLPLICQILYNNQHFTSAYLWLCMTAQCFLRDLNDLRRACSLISVYTGCAKKLPPPYDLLLMTRQQFKIIW